MFEFEFDLTLKEYIRYNMYHQSHAPYFKQRNLLSRLGVPIVLLVILIFAIAIKAELKTIIILAVLFTIISVLYNLLYNQVTARTLNRQVMDLDKEGRCPYNKHSILKFNNDSLIEISPTEESNVDYDTIEKIVEITGLLLIYISTLNAIIMPVSVFTSQEQKEAFISFLEDRTGIESEIITSPN